MISLTNIEYEVQFHSVSDTIYFRDIKHNVSRLLQTNGDKNKILFSVVLAI